MRRLLRSLGLAIALALLIATSALAQLGQNTLAATAASSVVGLSVPSSSVVTVVNSGPSDAVVAFGPSSVVAQTTGPFSVPAGWAVPLFTGGGSYMAAITASGTANLTVISGVGFSGTPSGIAGLTAATTTSNTGLGSVGPAALVINTDPQDTAFVAFGESAVVATTAGLVVPPASAIPLYAGSSHYVAAITSAGSAKLIVVTGQNLRTPGEFTRTGASRYVFNSGVGVVVRNITVAGAVTMTNADYFICVKKTVGAATTVTLPPSPVQGDTYLIKDCKGDAATNNITLIPATGTVDGAANLPMQTNYQSLAVTYNGSEWSLN